MFQVHAKSLLLGLFAGAAGVAALAAGYPGGPEPAVAGRYEVEATGNGTGVATAYVIDTATGQVWISNDAEFAKPKLNRGFPVSARGMSGMDRGYPAGARPDPRGGANPPSDETTEGPTAAEE